MLSPEGNFSPLSNEVLIKVYMAEIKPFDAATKRPQFTQIIENIENYHSFISKQNHQVSDPIDTINQLSKGSRIIKIAGMSQLTREILDTAHISACCILLENSQLELNRLVSRESYLIPERQKFLANPALSAPDQVRILMKRLIGMDAVRTMQILRYFGLIKRKPGEMFQLGLGTATGDKDINYVHFEPCLISKNGYNGTVLQFGHNIQQAADVIISDLDPRYKELYENLNDNDSNNVKGYLGDVLEVLDNLNTADITKRNLVTLLRIEPAMIPDAKEFLKHLYPIVSGSCDFVLSIGAGDTPEAYKKRIDVVSDMFKQLENADLKPVLFQLHKGGNVIKQATSLQFGSGWASSYEILYCNINHDSLKSLF